MDPELEKKMLAMFFGALSNDNDYKLYCEVIDAISEAEKKILETCDRYWGKANDFVLEEIRGYAHSLSRCCEELIKERRKMIDSHLDRVKEEVRKKIESG